MNFPFQLAYRPSAFVTVDGWNWRKAMKYRHHMSNMASHPRCEAHSSALCTIDCSTF